MWPEAENEHTVWGAQKHPLLNKAWFHNALQVQELLRSLYKKPAIPICIQQHICLVFTHITLLHILESKM
jgi:hypothetical protein